MNMYNVWWKFDEVLSLDTNIYYFGLSFKSKKKIVIVKSKSALIFLAHPEPKAKVSYSDCKILLHSVNRSVFLNVLAFRIFHFEFRPLVLVNGIQVIQMNGHIPLLKEEILLQRNSTWLHDFQP